MKARGVFLSAAAILLAASAYAGDPLRSLARRLRTELRDTPGLSVCVMNFPYARERTSTGSHLVSERLITYLVQDGVVVIERRLLSELLSEKKLMQSGVASQKGARPAARVAGVDAVVIGTLVDLPGDETEVNARVVRVDSSKVIATARAVIPRTWMDGPRLPAPEPRSVAVPGAMPPLAQAEEAIPVAGGEPPPAVRYYPAPVPNFFTPVMIPTRGGAR